MKTLRTTLLTTLASSLMPLCLLLLLQALTRGENAVEAWVQRYNATGNSSDWAEAVIVDGSGNVYVTGASSADGFYRDYVRIKYSTTGVPLWTNRYNGPWGWDDNMGPCVAVDGSGDVIVTGSSYNESRYGDDYLTIKFSSQGTPLWTNRHTGTGTADNYARAVAVDGSNDVIVTGCASRIPPFDLLTIKYSAAGMPLWTNRYRGQWGGIIEKALLAVDGSNNVILTGSSAGGGGADDYATIKYSSTGVLLWTNHYNGPSNGDDIPTALAVDGSGDVYVAGYSTNSGSGYDYLTIKYSSLGVPLWTNRYNGTANNHDTATALVVDFNGDVIVTGGADGYGSGLRYATIKYSSAGVALWTNQNYSGRAYAVTVDGSRNVYVSGGGDTDYKTIKYSSEGVPLWTNRYNGPQNSTDIARAVAVDGSGNVYVTGGSFGSGGIDWATVKYVPSPTITAQPANRTNNVGTQATFTVTATGAQPLSYQWSRNGSSLPDGGNVSGATTVVLTLSNVTTNEAGSYSVVVTNIAGSVSSSNAVLTVLVPPAIVSQPASRTNTAGTTATFSVAASGTAPFNYHWVKNETNYLTDDGTHIFGVATVSLMLSNVLKADEGSYSVVVTNFAGAMASSNAMLTVVDPGVLTQPTSRTSVAGTMATFAVTAMGTEPLSYQWIKNGTNYLTDDGAHILGAATASLMLSNVLKADEGGYSVVVTNPVGSVTSSVAMLIVPVHITGAMRNGTNLIYGGTGGMEGSNYYVLTSTNIATRMTNWVRVATNVFGDAGTFSVTNAIDPGMRRQFFRLQVP